MAFKAKLRRLDAFCIDKHVSASVSTRARARKVHMGGCQNYDPFWGALNIRCRSIMGIQKGTIILTATYVLKPAPAGEGCKTHGNLVF